MLKIVKVYIILSFMPAYSFWLVFRYKETIRSQFLKSMMSPLIFIFSVIAGSFILYKIAAFSQRYAFDSIVRTAKDTQNWLYYSTQIQGGSGYSFGNIDYSTIGIIKVFPKAVNVALFRPYLWEARKTNTYSCRIRRFNLVIFYHSTYYTKQDSRDLRNLILNQSGSSVLFGFLYHFAFSVGFTSYNFGTLVRYKIPLMPFYYIALFILSDKDKTTVFVKKPTPVKKKPPATKLAPA
jgi:hypothetical protein